jgi:hypothetical protein
VLPRREGDRAGAVSGHERLMMGAGRHADELPAPLGEQAGDLLRVLPIQGLAGDHNGAGGDVAGTHAGLGVGPVKERLQGVGVNACVSDVGREQDRALVQQLPVGHRELRRVLGAPPAHGEPGDHQVRGR